MEPNLGFWGNLGSGKSSGMWDGAITSGFEIPNMTLTSRQTHSVQFIATFRCHNCFAVPLSQRKPDGGEGGGGANVGGSAWCAGRGPRIRGNAAQRAGAVQQMEDPRFRGRPRGHAPYSQCASRRSALVCVVHALLLPTCRARPRQWAISLWDADVGCCPTRRTAHGCRATPSEPKSPWGNRAVTTEVWQWCGVPSIDRAAKGRVTVWGS